MYLTLERRYIKGGKASFLRPGVSIYRHIFCAYIHSRTLSLRRDHILKNRFLDVNFQTHWTFYFYFPIFHYIIFIKNMFLLVGYNTMGCRDGTAWVLFLVSQFTLSLKVHVYIFICFRYFSFIFRMSTTKLIFTKGLQGKGFPGSDES